MRSWWMAIGWVAMALAGSLYGQTDYLLRLDARGLPDSARIDLINDHAWELSHAHPDSAEWYAREAVTRSERIGGYPKGLINAHTVLGILNKDKGYYGLSVEHYLQAMHVAERKGDSLRVSSCLNNIGSVYFQQANYPKALAHFQQSLGIENRLGRDKGQASIRLVNIGDAYFKMDSLDKAAAYYYNSLLIEEELKNEDGMFYARIGIGRVETRKGNHANALSELKRAMVYAQHLNNLPGICETHTALGELHLAAGTLPEAAVELEAAVALAEEHGFQGLLLQALEAMYRVRKAQGDLNAAIQELERYYALQEKLNSAEVSSRIGELQMRYELDKKERALAAARQQEQVAAAEAHYERKLRNYLLFSVLLTLVVVVLRLVRPQPPAHGN
ncbi:MAG: tetratricopeptide repeat protein [Bacteroidia bacterium]